MWKNMSNSVHNLTIFEHFLSFNYQNLLFCLLKRKLRAALTPLDGRVFENPALIEEGTSYGQQHGRPQTFFQGRAKIFQGWGARTYFLPKKQLKRYHFPKKSLKTY
jgi:hypothetical protein